MNRTARPEAPGSRWRRSFVRFVLLTLAFVPLIVLILEIIRFHVDIPFWDQWNFVPLLGKALDGDLHISDLWQQHNEHRLIFPRLLMVGLARISAYNILHELVANILLATGILVLITWQFFRAKRALNLGGIPWVVPVF
ncbi:MAG: hypothetical protein FJY81_07125, partial [Candidatus Aminicenantes bacterium]|nr:hypothetical protein [Candidatus Aminicenantes bacterium]